jgi:galactokinase
MMQDTLMMQFQTRFSGTPSHMVRAPGRVNLIGEHTDYNDGFVLPMAIDRDVLIALRPQPDRRINLISLDFSQEADFPLDEFAHVTSWDEYVRAAAWALKDHGYSLKGWEGVLASDIPIGAGLSSSAALEMAVILAFSAVGGFRVDREEMARIGQKAENLWVGAKTGIMDQMVSANGVEGHALLIDCRSLEITPTPLPAGIKVLVLDTDTRRGLVDSAYNERRDQCNQAAGFFDVPALRDLTLAELEGAKAELDPLVYRRARHVVTENARVLQAVEAMKQDDRQTLGRLVNASHTSLKEDFEVSSPELDIIVEIAQKQAGCFGARMTGAGFGGCALALVDETSVDRFTEEVRLEYREKTSLHPEIYVCSAAEGANFISFNKPA